MHIEKRLLNLFGSVGIIRPRGRRRFKPSFLDDSDPMDVVLLSDELFCCDHQLVQVVHDAEGRADSNAVVP